MSRPMAANFNGLIMDTTQPSSYFISPSDLSAQLLSRGAPLVIDVRKYAAFMASELTLPGALRRDPAKVSTWASSLPTSASVVVYCVHGHGVSQSTMLALRQIGLAATYVQGGFEAWCVQNLPVQAKVKDASTRWVTRERPKIDRIACPWLIRRFVDADAEFLYVPTEQVRHVAAEQSAMAYDVGPHVAETIFTHEGELCSFDAFLKHYHLGHDTALTRLATIIRAADTDRLELAPQAAGLLSISLGMSRLQAADLAMLDAMLPLYDALYAWCRDAVAGQDEKHNWKPV